MTRLFSLLSLAALLPLCATVTMAQDDPEAEGPSLSEELAPEEISPEARRAQGEAILFGLQIRATGQQFTASQAREGLVGRAVFSVRLLGGRTIVTLRSSQPSSYGRNILEDVRAQVAELQTPSFQVPTLDLIVDTTTALGVSIAAEIVHHEERIARQLKNISQVGSSLILFRLNDNGTVAAAETMATSSERFAILAQSQLEETIFNESYPTDDLYTVLIIVEPQDPEATTEPQPVYEVPPQHPDALATQSGNVTLDVRIDTRGRPIHIRVVEASHPAFAVAAEEAVAQWRFSPRTVGGVASEAVVRVPLNFQP